MSDFGTGEWLGTNQPTPPGLYNGIFIFIQLTLYGFREITAAAGVSAPDTTEGGGSGDSSGSGKKRPAPPSVAAEPILTVREKAAVVRCVCSLNMVNYRSVRLFFTEVPA